MIPYRRLTNDTTELAKEVINRELTYAIGLSAIALLPNTASFNFNERINGKAYSGQRRTYYIFPQQPGRYEIPAIAVSVVPAHPARLVYPHRSSRFCFVWLRF